MSSITTARPYALAAFEEAQKQGDLKGWSEFLMSLAQAVSNPDILAIATSPRVPRTQLQGLMEAFAGEPAKVQQRNFVRILVENHRLLVLPEIAAIFESLRAEAERTVTVEVDSAYELSDTQKEKIMSALKTRTGRDVKMVCKVNKELLGGVVIRAGDQVIDGSARARLGELASALA